MWNVPEAAGASGPGGRQGGSPSDRALGTWWLGRDLGDIWFSQPRSPFAFLSIKPLTSETQEKLSKLTCSDHLCSGEVHLSVLSIMVEPQTR